jgi:hypothetical protein
MAALPTTARRIRAARRWTAGPWGLAVFLPALWVQTAALVDVEAGRKEFGAAEAAWELRRTLHPHHYRYSGPKFLLFTIVRDGMTVDARLNGSDEWPDMWIVDSPPEGWCGQAWFGDSTPALRGGWAPSVWVYDHTVQIEGWPPLSFAERLRVRDDVVRTIAAEVASRGDRASAQDRRFVELLRSGDGVTRERVPWAWAHDLLAGVVFVGVVRSLVWTPARVVGFGRAFIAMRRREADRCACGYSTIGLPRGVCPECGRTVAGR